MGGGCLPTATNRRVGSSQSLSVSRKVFYSFPGVNIIHLIGCVDRPLMVLIRMIITIDKVDYVKAYRL